MMLIREEFKKKQDGMKFEEESLHSGMSNVEEKLHSSRIPQNKIFQQLVLQEPSEERQSKSHERSQGEGGGAVAEISVTLAHLDEVVVGALVVAVVALALQVAAVPLDAELGLLVDVHPHLAAEGLGCVVLLAGDGEGVLEGGGVHIELIRACRVLVGVAGDALQGFHCAEGDQDDSCCDEDLHLRGGIVFSPLRQSKKVFQA